MAQWTEGGDDGGNGPRDPNYLIYLSGFSRGRVLKLSLPQITIHFPSTEYAGGGDRSRELEGETEEDCMDCS